MRHQRCPSRFLVAAVASLLLCFLPGLLPLTNASYFVSASDEDGAGTAGYCQLCERHTMCLFPFDDVGPKCIDVENGDLDPEEILSIVHQHNVQRNNIARGIETRGNPGPQPPARNMMELTWDEELARIARRWAIQCHLYEKDECRDVERFAVWQNVNALYLDSGMEMGSSSSSTSGASSASEEQDSGLEDDGNTSNATATAFMRIRFHVQSWLDEVEHFDTASVGLVDFGMENETSYVAIAGAKITRVGCGRAMYTVDSAESNDEVEAARPEVAAGGAPEAAEVASNKNATSTSRVEVLVCNYGPIDRATPQILYEYGALESCPDGSVPSNKYDHLCATTSEPGDFSPRDSEDRSAEEEAARDPSWRSIVGSGDAEEERRSSSSSSSSSRSSAVSIALRKSTSATSRSTSFHALAEFLSLVLLHIITKAPGARCCWSC